MAMTMTISNNSSAKRITVQIPTSSGDAIEAWVYLPEGSGPHPAVVMAHGIGGIKAGGLAPFAERFREEGFAAISRMRRNLERSELSLFLGDVQPAVGMGFVPACFEVVPYSRKEIIQSDGFDGLKCLTVDPSRTTASSRVSFRVTWTKMPQKRCAFSDFAFQYIRRRSSCNAMGAFVISPLASLGQTEFLIGPGPSLRARFAARPSTVPYDPIRLPDAYPSISHSRL